MLPGLERGAWRRPARAWIAAFALLAAPVPGLISLAFASTLRVGAPAPALVLHGLDGRATSTQDLEGKVVIVTFWATWCAPCRAELPTLSDYASRHRQDGLVVLGFSLDGPDSAGAVQSMARDLAFPVGLLGSAYAGGYGRIWRIPVSFVIARDGTLADNGWDDAAPAWTQARLDRVVGPLLAARAAQTRGRPLSPP